MVQLKIHQLYFSLEYCLLNAQEIPFQELKTAFYYILENFFQELVYTSLKKHDSNVQYHVSKSLPSTPRFPAESVLPQEQLCRDTLNIYFFYEQHGQLTKCSFCIVFKWIFRNANFILWCYNSLLDLFCWVADSMSVTRKLVDLSIYKVPYRKTFISTAVLSFLLILRILVCSFFMLQL